jgi:hypothetical protein
MVINSSAPTGVSHCLILLRIETRRYIASRIPKMVIPTARPTHGFITASVVIADQTIVKPPRPMIPQAIHATKSITIRTSKCLSSTMSCVPSSSFFKDFLLGRTTSLTSTPLRNSSKLSTVTTSSGPSFVSLSATIHPIS